MLLQDCAYSAIWADSQFLSTRKRSVSSSAGKTCEMSHPQPLGNADQSPRRYALSDNQFSSLPEVDMASGKEAATIDEKETAIPSAHDKILCGYQAMSPPQLETSSSNKELSYRGRNKLALWICALIAIFMVLGIALGVGLGFGLKSNTSSQSNSDAPKLSPTNANGSEPDPNLSIRGAFNGSGLSAMGITPARNLTSLDSAQAFGDQFGLLLFFQHHTGEIRWMQRIFQETWVGGSPYEVVATDAKNNTPISVTNSRMNDALQIHVFYIDKGNMLRQRSIDNLTAAWSDGLINSLNVKTLDADTVGLTVNFYSGPINGVNLNGTEADGGMRLWVATSETQFEQYSWRPGLSQWVWEQSWLDQNGAASPATYSWAPGSTTYVMFIDIQNTANLYWRDAGSNAVNTPSHPVNQWTKSGVSISNIDPAMGIGFHSGFYGRLVNGLVGGWNVTFAAENSTLIPSALSTVNGHPAGSDKSIAIWSRLSSTDAVEILLFFQTTGDDVTMFFGSAATGAWNSTALPIPDA